MLDFLPDEVKDFFKFWKKYPMRLIGYGVGCYALGRWSIAAGIDIPYIPLI